jgi:hypothetical protein
VQKFLFALAGWVLDNFLMCTDTSLQSSGKFFQWPPFQPKIALKERKFVETICEG